MTTEDQDAKSYEAPVTVRRGDVAAVRGVIALAKLGGSDTSTLNDLLRRHAHSTPGEFLPEEMAV